MIPLKSGITADGVKDRFIHNVDRKGGNMKAHKIILIAVLFVLFAVSGYSQNAENVEWVGSWPYGPANAVAVDVARGLTFLGSGGGVVILNSRDISNPVEIKRFKTAGPVEDLHYEGGILYIANGAAGLTAKDVSDPVNPSTIYTKAYPEQVKKVDVYSGEPYVVSSNGILYTSQWQEGGMISPAPDPSGFYDSDGHIVDADIIGSIGYVIDRIGVLRIVDLTDPASPVEAGYDYLPGEAYGITVSYPYAYVTYSVSGEQRPGLGLSIFDITAPTSPKILGSFNNPFAGIPGGLAVSGGYAYIGDQFGVLHVIDVRIPTDPAMLTTFSRSGMGSISSVFASGNAIYIADDKAGLFIIDHPDLEIQSFFNAPGWMYDIFASGELVFLADDEQGLSIADISDPVSPKLESTYKTSGTARGIFVSGTDAYVADGNAGLKIIDVSAPSLPIEIGSIDTVGDSRGVFVSGNYAYIADGDRGGLRIIDVLDPTLPNEVGYYDTPGSAGAVFVSGNHAYVADGAQGVTIIDVSNPEIPIRVGSYNTLGSVYAVHVEGNYAYVADWTNGLLILDVSVPEGPVFAASITTPTEVRDLYVSGNNVFVADWQTGVRVIDVSNPTAPVMAGYYASDSDNYGIYVQNDRLYVAEGPDGFTILRYKTAIPGDLNNSETIDLSDAIVALKVLAGIEPSGLRTNYAGSGADINGDDRVGYPELLYILQTVSGLRPQ